MVASLLRAKLWGRCRPTAVVAAALAAALAGCLGPQAVKQTRLRYNEAYSATSEEQLLLNIVRMRYAESPQFIDLPSITGQFEVTGRGAYAGGLDGQGPGRTNLGTAEMFLRDAPTLSYAPRRGEQFGRSLARPLAAEVIRLVVGTTNLAPFLLMATNDANDISNARRATALLPDRPDDNAEFRELLGLIAALDSREGCELVIDTVEVETSDPVPASTIQGESLLLAARSDYVYRAQGAERYTLKKRQKAVALHIRESERQSFEAQEIARLLDLAPGLDVYRIRSELIDDQEDDDFDDLPNPLGDDTIFLNMRSILEIMAFLSKGVCIPPDHVASGEAPTLCDADGRPFNWSHVTAGLFAVSSGPKRPKDAEVAVRYRDHWFWIDRRDVASRASLTTLELLLSLQEADEKESGPLLTLPVGG